MFLGFWANNIFMPGMSWCFRTICISLYVICFLVFRFNCRCLFFDLMGTWRIFIYVLFPSLWGLRGKILFSSLRGLRGFLFKYYFRPYVDL